MSSLSLPEMLGKTCLPCLPLRCWGRHVFPVFARDVGEDIWGCWGRHLEMSGKTGNIGEDTQGYWGGHQEDGDDIGEVRDDGEDIGEDGDDIREDG